MTTKQLAAKYKVTINKISRVYKSQGHFKGWERAGVTEQRGEYLWKFIGEDDG